MDISKIATFRQNKKFSQEELAEKSGVSRGIISQLETGKAKEVKLGTLRKIAKALDVKVTELL